MPMSRASSKNRPKVGNTLLVTPAANHPMRWETRWGALAADANSDTP
jgi:hypothetical protein